MLEIIIAGGWLMVPILHCSTLAVAMIIERFWTLRESKVLPKGLSSTVEDWAARHELEGRHIEQLRPRIPPGAYLCGGIGQPATFAGSDQGSG